MQKSLLLVIAAGAGIGFMLPTGEPSAPAAAAAPAGKAVETRLERRENGHFYVDAEVGDQYVNFLVDTGASTVALTMDDAKRLGIPFSPAEFTVIAKGASGDVRGKTVTLDRVSIDGKEVREVRGMVIEGLETSLLGQSYLSRITSVEMGRDYMTLR
jgi:aspartyl protease family protein